MTTHDFFQVPRDKQTTSQGEVELPILYYDCSVVMAFFSTRLENAAAKLQNTGLTPYRFISGRALVGLAFFEYRQTSVGAYNEVALALPVYPQSLPAPLPWGLPFFQAVGKRKVGFYIVDLPVTTAMACAAGREIWGYPKFVTEISFEQKKDYFSSTVFAPGSPEAIFTFQGKLGRSLPAPFFDLLLFSQHEQKMLKTIVDVKATMQLRFSSRLKLSMGQIAHPMAQNLLALELPQARPLLTMTCSNYCCRLNRGLHPMVL